jgi:hypothetical protein
MSSTRRSIIEPFKIKVIEPLPLRTVAEREQIPAAGWNLSATRRRPLRLPHRPGTTAMIRQGRHDDRRRELRGSRSFTVR